MTKSVNFIEPPIVRKLLLSDVEHAVLDAREEGEFGASHMFWAVPCPLSRMELRVPTLLPSKFAAVVCVDDGQGQAQRLASYLNSMGYINVMVLKGGIHAWRDAGFVLFSGVNVPSKAFGEWVEHHFGTESIDARELNHWLVSGRNMIVVDSRPHSEFVRMSIPTGINVPGGELVYRIGDLAPDPDTVVVVNCAGRTRSILGAESLRRARIPNRVVALRNGTMGWELAGLTIARGQIQRFPSGAPKSEKDARARAKRFADESGVEMISPAKLAIMQADPSRTSYLLDVRNPEEFAAGHYPGSINAPGGQLLQETDHWVAVRNAWIVLIDSDGVRARMAASWLRQMGHQSVFVVDGALPMTETESDATPGDVITAVEEISASDLAAAKDCLVVDLARSIDFRENHIPGAVWAVRTRLDKLPELKSAKRVVLTSPDGILAKLAVAEVQSLTSAPVLVLSGGTESWIRATFATAADRFMPDDDECVDCYLRPFDRNHRVEEAMQDYLVWEVDLVKHIERDGTVRFGVERT